MRRLVAGLCLGFASVGAALATPAMTTVPTQMRQEPSSHSPVVQSIPRQRGDRHRRLRQDLVLGVLARHVGLRARERDRGRAGRAAAGLFRRAASAGVVVAPPLVVAPFGCCWGPGWGYGHPWRHYY